MPKGDKLTAEVMDTMFLSSKQREIGKEVIVNYIECFHLGMWWRQFAAAREVIVCLDTIRGLKGLLSEKQAIWLEKARKLLRWVLLDENIELKRNTLPQSRCSKEYQQWRIACLERDSYLCMDCGSKKDLHVHHKQSYLSYPVKRLDVGNGVVLRKDCHWKEHRK